MKAGGRERWSGKEKFRQASRADWLTREEQPQRFVRRGVMEDVMTIMEA